MFMNTLTWEKRHPIGLGLIAAAAAGGSAHYGVNLPSDSAFYSSVITLGGIFAAFAVTLKSMMLSNEKKMKILADSGYKPVFMGYISSSVDGALLLCFIGLLGFFDQLSALLWFAPLVIGCFVYALLALRRITLVSNAVIKQTERRNAG
ncbi:hypothetical protein [Vreelandella populi]|uniref:hypothetical protein n=1 Tax=Vreelandella populi TaxID=2498858 RepID=UPI000F8D2A5B|nr:hypothetical protein [Halomonas populi]RUR52689.1 hypothetical protein ELY40_11605 [Halomonas populi]